jgi:hypothetical protein
LPPRHADEHRRRDPHEEIAVEAPTRDEPGPARVRNEHKERDRDVPPGPRAAPVRTPGEEPAPLRLIGREAAHARADRDRRVPRRAELPEKERERADVEQHEEEAEPAEDLGQG